MKNRIPVVAIAAVFLLATMAFAADVYNVDPVHSTIGFKVRHMGISYVTGKFDKFEGQLTFDGDKLASIEGKVDASSIDTAQAGRDEHLKGDEFFSAAKFPSIDFKTTKVTLVGNVVAVVGNLTIRDVTKVVELQGEFGGFANTEKGKKTGLVLNGEINRKDFGLQFNKLLESGQAMVGDQVQISLEIEAQQAVQKTAETAN